MKVLHVYFTTIRSSYGGVEYFIDSLCKETSLLGVKNTVYSINKYPINKKMVGYEIVEAKESFSLGSLKFSFEGLFRFRRLVKNFDIIHYHFPNPFADLMHVINFIKKPYLITYHSDIIRQYFSLQIYKPLMKIFLKHSESIIATSPDYLNTSKVLQRYKNKVRVIPIGINDLSRDVNIELISKWKSKLPKDFFLFIGSPRYYKGLDYLISAFLKLESNLVILGDGPEMLNLKNKFNLCSHKNIITLGKQDEQNKKAILSLSYSLILPSIKRSEAFGISLLEGAIFGKPLISSELGTGTSFININNKTGIVIEPCSSGNIIKAVNYLKNNNKIAKKYGESARDRALKDFNLKKISKKYFEIYNSILN